MIHTIVKCRRDMAIHDVHARCTLMMWISLLFSFRVLNPPGLLVVLLWLLGVRLSIIAWVLKISLLARGWGDGGEKVREEVEQWESVDEVDELNKGVKVVEVEEGDEIWR